MTSVEMPVEFTIKGNGLDKLMEMLSQEELERRATELWHNVMPPIAQEASNQLEAQLGTGDVNWELQSWESASVLAKLKNLLAAKLGVGVKAIKLIPRRGGAAIVLASKKQSEQTPQQGGVLRQVWDSPQVQQVRQEAMHRFFLLRRG